MRTLAEDGNAIERHARLKRLFFRAVELDRGERRRFLSEACAGDAELLTDLESLLTHHELVNVSDTPGSSNADETH